MPIDPRCLTCDYLLRATTDPRCPECGRPFNPADPATLNLTGEPFPTLARLVAKPISLPFFALTHLAGAWPLREHRTKVSSTRPIVPPP